MDRRTCRDCERFNRQASTTFIICREKAKSDRAKLAHEYLTTASSTPCDQFAPLGGEAWGLFA